ncbi:MAG TPA: CGNR zinc finger domain-containing protein [Pseudonocardiaceae bacterium]|nr:CGNR zinc finger domain-containing protein [Pseudonocardiaceae bacterium]
MTRFSSGNGAAWLDLLAQLAGRYRERQVDSIDNAATLREWLREYGQEPTDDISTADVEQFQAVREALHRTTVAVMCADHAQAADVGLLAHALEADRPLGVRLTDGGIGVVRPASAGEALARLVRDAVQDLSGPQRAYLRPCGDDTCSGVFFDRTGHRRWCSDERCGNRMRVRAHRARLAKPDA